MAAAKQVAEEHKSRSLSSIDKHESIFSMKEGCLTGSVSDKPAGKSEGKHVMWWREATRKILHSLLPDRDDVTLLTNGKKGSAAVRNEMKVPRAKKLSLMKNFYSEDLDSDMQADAPNTAHSTEAMNNLSVRSKVAHSTSDNASSYSTTSECFSYKTIADVIAEDVPSGVPEFKHARDKQLATCLLCRSVLKQPRLLECLHSFCEVCLVRHLEHNKLQSRQLVILCPSCHTETSLPRAGVTALPEDHVAEAVLKGSNTTATHVSTPPTPQQAVTCQNCFKRPAQWKCSSCSASLLCDLCNTVVHVMQSKDGLGTVLLAAHYVSPLHKAVRTYTGNDANVVLPCINHDKQEAVSFCVTCSEPVCVACRQSLHHAHSLCPPSDAVSLVRNELKLRLSQLEEASKISRSDLHNSELLKSNLLYTRAQLLEDLDTHHQQLKLAVDTWYKEQCAQVSLAFVSELNSVSTWNTQCSAKQLLLDSTHTYVRKALEMEHWFHLLSFFCASKRRLKSLTQTNGLSQQHTCSIPDITVSLTDTASFQQQLGSIHIQSKSFKDQATNGGTYCERAERRTTQCNNGSCLPWEQNSTHWDSANDANTLPTLESESSSSQDAFRSSLGLGPIQRHQVVAAKHVPLKMCLFPLDQCFSTRSEVNCSTLSTGGISLSHDGKQVVVTDRATHTVSVFDCNGRLSRQIRCQQVLVSPHSAIILTSGDIVVACDSASEQRPLVVFGNSGTFKLFVDTDDDMQPSALATNYLGTFVVYDRRLTCLHVFDSNTFRMLFRQPVSSPDTALGNIWDSVAMSGAGSVFVSSFLGHRIDQFSSRLHRLAKYGSRGKETGQLQGPAGLCMDTAGNVVVADSLNGRLQVLTRDGHMQVVAMKARATVSWPVGVAMDETGRTYVLEHDGVVKVFQYA